MLKIKESVTAKNTAISPNFTVWKFCGMSQYYLCGNFTKFPLQEIR